jgi:hypothetical protein
MCSCTPFEWTLPTRAVCNLSTRLDHIIDRKLPEKVDRRVEPSLVSGRKLDANLCEAHQRGLMLPPQTFTLAVQGDHATDEESADDCNHGRGGLRQGGEEDSRV